MDLNVNAQNKLTFHSLIPVKNIEKTGKPFL